MAYPEDCDELLGTKMQRDYKRTINEEKLLNLPFEKFKKPSALYMNRVAPILLTQFLRERDPHLPREIVHDIRLTKRRVHKPDNPLTKITFSPFGLSKLPLATLQRPKLHVEKVKEKPIHSKYRVDCETPTYLLQKVLPLHFFDTSAAHPSDSKHKLAADVGVEKGAKSTPTAKKPRPTENLDLPRNCPPSRTNKKIAEPPIELPVQESDLELRLSMPRKRVGMLPDNENMSTASSLKPNARTVSDGKSSGASANTADVIDLTGD